MTNISPTLSRRISPTVWRGYNSTDSDAWITADFLRRYGVEPEEIVRGVGCSTVLVGPVPEVKEMVYNENV